MSKFTSSDIGKRVIGNEKADIYSITRFGWVGTIINVHEDKIQVSDSSSTDIFHVNPEFFDFIGSSKFKVGDKVVPNQSGLDKLGGCFSGNKGKLCYLLITELRDEGEFGWTAYDHSDCTYDSCFGHDIHEEDLEFYQPHMRVETASELREELTTTSNMIEYTTRKGVITQVGPERTSFPNGNAVTVKKYSGEMVPGVNIGVKFDFDMNNWYTANLEKSDLDKFISKGKSIEVKTWEKESGGKTYYNFAIVYPKKIDPAVEKMKESVEANSAVLSMLVKDVTDIKAWIIRHDTTTMFDDGAPIVHPDEARAMYGDDGAYVPPMDSEDINPEDIPF